jgi:hypothetical protein
MKRQTHSRALGLAFVLLTIFSMPAIAGPQRYDTRREIREGAYEVNQERRGARREIATADSPMERRQEVREASRQISRERREAEREIRNSRW